MFSWRSCVNVNNMVNNVLVRMEGIFKCTEVACLALVSELDVRLRELRSHRPSGASYKNVVFQSLFGVK